MFVSVVKTSFQLFASVCEGHGSLNCNRPRKLILRVAPAALCRRELREPRDMRHLGKHRTNDR